MKRNKNTIKKIFILIFVIAEAFLISLPQVLAFDYPSPTEIAKTMEKRYHLNTNSIQNAGEAFNVASTKSTAPQVMITFEPTDPKPGEKVTARANPMYFGNPEEDLYYIWYLQRVKTNSSGGIRTNNNGQYEYDTDIEHCKNIAMRIIANGGFDISKADYSSDTDDDGYKATYGGDHQRITNDRCYIHDFKSGTNYQLVSGGNYSSGDYSPMCDSGTASCAKSGYDPTVSCTTAHPPGTGTYPSCDGTDVECPVGYSPYCFLNLDDPLVFIPQADPDILQAADSCENLDQGGPICTNGGNANLSCHHLFPEALGSNAINGTFGLSQEKFWHTNPHDSDTADNGNTDGANVVGLGQYTFTWNYQEGDKVGVVVEGVSMLPTKYDDASYMIMWALPKNKCDIGNTGTITRKIKGYNVSIPVASVDIDNCLLDNVVDPRDKAYEKLDVNVSYSPDNPTNDSTTDQMGDTVVAQASVNNDSDLSQLKYKWTVKVSNDASFDEYKTITSELIDAKLINGPVEGIGNSSLALDLNLNKDNFSDFNTYFNDENAYIRFSVEIVSEDNARQGKSDVIVKVIDSSTRIEAYTAKTQGGKLELDNPICTKQSGEGNNLQRYTCFVVKNEVIGVTVPDNTLQNFSWKLNDDPLICDSSVSSSCASDVTSGVNFFPVMGNSGDSYIVTMSANDGAGRTVELSRTFQVIDPYVKIVSADGNKSSWPKYLGSYQDLNGKTFDDLSDDVYQTLMGNKVELQAEFHPDWIGQYYSDNKWTLNGQLLDTTAANISFDATDDIGSAYNAEFETVYSNSANDLALRKAMQDIWGISQFDSTKEEVLSGYLQVEVADSGTTAAAKTKQFMAALFSNTPSNVVFMIRIILCIFLIIATSSFVFALQPKRLL